MGQLNLLLPRPSQGQVAVQIICGASLSQWLPRGVSQCLPTTKRPSYRRGYAMQPVRWDFSDRSEVVISRIAHMHT